MNMKFLPNVKLHTDTRNPQKIIKLIRPLDYWSAKSKNAQIVSINFQRAALQNMEELSLLTSKISKIDYVTYQAAKYKLFCKMRTESRNVANFCVVVVDDDKLGNRKRCTFLKGCFKTSKSRNIKLLVKLRYYTPVLIIYL